MFGNNPTRKQDLRTDGTLDVQEVFYTIQGEGPSAGRPAVFIRLAGCNLRCYFCDTDFESGMGNQMTVPEIIHAVATSGGLPAEELLVVLTGGEPLRQNIVPLVKALEQRGAEVEIETAGTLWVPGLGDTSARIICSPKTAKLAPEVYERAAAFKYIIKNGCVDDKDGLPVLSTQLHNKRAELARPRPGAAVYVQPMDEQGADDGLNLTYTVSRALKFGYRVSLQQHKLMGVA